MSEYDVKVIVFKNNEKLKIGIKMQNLVSNEKSKIIKQYILDEKIVKNILKNDLIFEDGTWQLKENTQLSKTYKFYLTIGSMTINVDYNNLFVE